MSKQVINTETIVQNAGNYEVLASDISIQSNNAKVGIDRLVASSLTGVDGQALGVSMTEIGNNLVALSTLVQDLAGRMRTAAGNFETTQTGLAASFRRG